MIDFLTNFGTLLAVLTILTTIGVYLYGTSKKSRADIIRQDNADLRASNNELRTEKAGYVATITQQTDTIKNLREVATQTPQVTQLLELTGKQQITINKQHADVIHQLSELAKEISKMTAEFSHVAKAMQKNTIAQESSKGQKT